MWPVAKSESTPSILFFHSHSLLFSWMSKFCQVHVVECKMSPMSVVVMLLDSISILSGRMIDCWVLESFVARMWESLSSLSWPPVYVTLKLVDSLNSLNSLEIVNNMHVFDYGCGFTLCLTLSLCVCMCDDFSVCMMMILLCPRI